MKVEKRRSESTRVGDVRGRRAAHRGRVVSGAAQGRMRRIEAVRKRKTETKMTMKKSAEWAGGVTVEVALRSVGVRRVESRSVTAGGIAEED